MINQVNYASKMLDIEPEKIKGFILLAVTSEDTNFSLSQFAVNNNHRMALYAMMPVIQKMLLDSFQKELDRKGLE